MVHANGRWITKSCMTSCRLTMDHKMMHDFKTESNRSIDNHGSDNLPCPHSDT